MTLIVVFSTLGAYVGAHFLFFFSILKIFSLSPNIYVYMGIGVSIFIPIFSLMIHRYFDESIGKYLYLMGMTYVGGVVISSYVFAVYQILSLKIHHIGLGYTALILSILLVGYSWYCGRNIVLKDITLHTSKATQEVKIAYMSDIHIDGINDANYVKRIVNHIKKINPDMVLINGDLVDGTTLNEAHFEGFKKIKVPIYATLGNHEKYRGFTYVEKLLSQTNIQLLKDQMIEYKGIQILGSNEISARGGTPDLSGLETFLSGANISPEKPALLLIHEPVGVEISQKYPIDLQFAGHTHNGQIWPLGYIAQFLYGYKYGMYQLGKLQLYVSSGTALWGPPLRLGTQNEIIVLSIKK